MAQSPPKQGFPGRFWRPDGAGKILCQLCPRACRLAEGQRAFCFVRSNQGGKMVLTTYGRSSGFCVDPIEKKPLNHFLPGTPVFSFGTAGCNLGCKFCQNWDISKAKEWDRLSDSASAEDIADAAVAAGARSVAFTYNDPVIWAEYAIDVAQACHARGLKTVAVTAGYITDEARPEFFSHMDAVNVDLKAFTEEFYFKLASGHLEPVLDTLRYLRHQTQVWLEVTTLIIPGHNDSESEIDRLCTWFADNLGTEVPLHFSAFHPDFKMTDVPRTPEETLQRARKQALAHGIAHVYTGNVNDAAGQSTYCGGCGARLIERDWYRLGEYRVASQGGRFACPDCQQSLAGVFETQPGSWGQKRLPVIVGA